MMNEVLSVSPAHIMKSIIIIIIIIIIMILLSLSLSLCVYIWDPLAGPEHLFAPDQKGVGRQAAQTFFFQTPGSADPRIPGSLDSRIPGIRESGDPGIWGSGNLGIPGFLISSSSFQVSST